MAFRTYSIWVELECEFTLRHGLSRLKHKSTPGVHQDGVKRYSMSPSIIVESFPSHFYTAKEADSLRVTSNLENTRWHQVFRESEGGSEEEKDTTRIVTGCDCQGKGLLWRER